MTQENFKKLMESSATMLENTANEMKVIKERYPDRQTARVEEVTQLIDEIKTEYKKADTGEDLGEIKPKNTQSVSNDVLKRVVSDNKEYEEVKMPTPKVHTEKLVVPPMTSRLNRKYDVIPLPSKGECYPHKKGKLPVYYLTAREENLIMSINLYSEGMLIETILKSVVADPEINVDELVQGDIDAILLFLRATAYGTKYPIIARNPYTGVEFQTNIDLSDIKYKELDLKGDENGWFDYTTEDGDKLKWGFPDFGEDKMFKKMIMDSSKTVALKRLETMIRDLNEIKESDILSITNKEIIERNNAVQSIYKIHDVVKKGVGDNILDNILLANMTRIIKTFNGESNRQVVYEQIANMRAGTARKFRQYYDMQIFGLNTVVEVKIPEGQEKEGETLRVNLSIDESFLMTVSD